MESMHLSSLSLSIAATVIGLLLSIIAFFLSRLLKQFDGLTTQVSNLNDTMKKIDKDLSGEVGIIQTRLSTVEEGLDELDPLWDRTRKCEDRLTAIEKGGCEIKTPHCGQ